MLRGRAALDLRFRDRLLGRATAEPGRQPTSKLNDYKQVGRRGASVNCVTIALGS